MEFGMPTLLEHASLAESAALCRELGLSFVEINMNLPQYQPEELASTLQKEQSGITYTLHLDENLNPFDFNPAVAEAYHNTALAAIKTARMHQMPVVNMHMPQGVYFSLPGERVYLYDRYWQNVRGNIERFRDEAAAAAGEDLLICIENTTFSGFHHLPDALGLLLSSPAFALTYDIGHDRLDHNRAQHFYASHADRVCHLHLHDADDASAHLPLGTGKIDLDHTLRTARNCRAVLETKDAPGLRASVNWLSERNYLV